jgi:hypothetical protein
MAKIIELIYTEEQRGLGTPENPVRLCPQLWTKDGKLVAEEDPEKHSLFEKEERKREIVFLPNNINLD